MINQIMLLLLMIITQSVSQDMRSLFISKKNNTNYQCIELGCLPHRIIFTVNLLKCKIACLSDVLCLAVTFNQSNKQCQIFYNIPTQHGYLLTQIDTVTLFVTDGRSIFTGKFNSYIS